MHASLHPVKGKFIISRHEIVYIKHPRLLKLNEKEVIMLSFFKTSDGVQLYYQSKGEGKPIVFVHGWSADHTSFEPTFEALSKNYRVISYDLRGHGLSEKPQHGLTLNRFAKDLEELMEFLDLRDITLAGHSMGASITFEYVKTFGISRLNSVTLLDMTPKLVNDQTWNLGLFHGKYGIEDTLKDLTTIFGNLKEFASSFSKITVPYLTDEESVEQDLRPRRKHAIRNHRMPSPKHHYQWARRPADSVDLWRSRFHRLLRTPLGHQLGRAF